MTQPRAGRLFLGVPLSDPLRDGLGEHLRRALSGGVPGRAVVPASWHLTLRFLGDTGADQHRRLVEALERAPLGPRFSMVLGGLGAFPRPRRAGVLWVGVDEGAAELKRVAALAEDAARHAGFPAEKKPFSPHLTIARLDPPRDVEAAVAAAPPFGGRMEVDGVVLFRSHLGSGPPRYEALQRFALR
ncbi:MAG TPA: RNA 2',3'-cyclic phosphodiesterase [Longimicrobium sp.]|nr:RNA 2',3'-cyclic phosphodiesterase [Longimicrobium sp.]